MSMRSSYLVYAAFIASAFPDRTKLKTNGEETFGEWTQADDDEEGGDKDSVPSNTVSLLQQLRDDV